MQSVTHTDPRPISSALHNGRILLIKPSSLGDIVHALPVVSAIKAQWPGVHLTWVVKRQWAELVRRVAGVDRVWPVDGGAVSWLKQGWALRAERFDVTVDLQGLFRSGAVAWLSGVPLRIGFANGREGSPWFYTTRVPVPTAEMHAVDRYLLVAEAMGVRVLGAPQFRFNVRDEDRAIVRNILSEKGISVDQPWVAMNVSARWITKRWPLSSFAGVIDRLHEEGRGPVVVIGSAEDRCDVDALRAVTTTPFIDLAGAVPLGCLPALLSKAGAMITNDSGPMHIAAAVGVPVVALFGPTSEVRTGPYGTGHRVLTGSVPCRPCFSRVCRHVPELECLRALTPDDVAEAVRDLLAAHARSS
ncbi:MAG TPA: lipopolysaccharide heptosyltransferase II [Nitrospira sp.]|nr:lipopolysaccharide heptosyltransferase II [Nitrospira sp.]